MNNHVSATLPEEELTAVLTALNNISQKMPFLLAIPEEEKKGMIKMGERSVDFVQDARMAASEHPEIFPAYFDHNEFDRDAQLLAQLLRVQLVMNELDRKINDTIMALGSDSLSAGLEVYTFLQAAVSRNPSLKPTLEKLASRFAAQRRSRKSKTVV